MTGNTMLVRSESFSGYRENQSQNDCFACDAVEDAEETDIPL